jgi:signal transduction histidine kinase
MKFKTHPRWLLSAALALIVILGFVWTAQTNPTEAVVIIFLSLIFSFIVAFVVLTEKTEEIDRAKNEFVSVAGHQLRTPITAIRWHGEMLLNSDLGPICASQKTSLERIHNSVVRVVSLINDLLNAARVESGHIQIVPVLTNPADLAKKVLKNFEPIIREKGIKVNTFLKIWERSILIQN